MRRLPPLGLAVGVAVALSACSAGGPVSDAEARVVASSLLSAATAAFESNDDDRYCEIVAADAKLCENSWSSWVQRGSPEPDLATVEVETEAQSDGSQVLTFTGTYLDGEAFTSEVVVANTGGGPRAADPVFWIDR